MKTSIIKEGIKMNQYHEAAQRLQDISNEIEGLVNEALEIVKYEDRDQYDRSYRSWGAAIITALKKDTDWLGRSTSWLLEQSIERITKIAEEVEAGDLEDEELEAEEG